MRAPALLLTAALTAFVAPASHAQIGGSARDSAIDIISGGTRPSKAPGWLAQRLTGKWSDGTVRMEFSTSRDGAVYAHAYTPWTEGKERHFAAMLYPNADGTALSGDWEDIGDYVERYQGGQWTVTMSNGGVVVNGPLHGRNQIRRLLPVADTGPVPALYKDWVGDWQVHDGILTLTMENGRMVGSYRLPAASGLKEARRELLFTGRTDAYETPGDTLVGLWQGVGDASMGGEARMTLLAGKRTFGGTLSGDPVYGAWRGERVGTAPTPAGGTREPETLPAPRPVPQAPVPSTPTPPRPLPSPPAPAEPAPAAEGFESLGRWDVRIDRVENPRDDRLTHVYVTLRNAGTQSLLQTGNVWVYLETSDGLTQQSGQGLRAVPGPPQLFGSPPPVVLPGKEIKAKYVFDRQRGVTLTSIMVMEGEHKAEFAF